MNCKSSTRMASKELRLLIDDLLNIGDFGEQSFFAEIDTIMRENETAPTEVHVPQERSRTPEIQPRTRHSQLSEQASKFQHTRRGGAGRGQLLELINNDYDDEARRAENLDKINSYKYRNEEIEALHHRQREATRKNKMEEEKEKEEEEPKKSEMESVPEIPESVKEPEIKESKNKPKRNRKDMNVLLNALHKNKSKADDSVINKSAVTDNSESKLDGDNPKFEINSEEKLDGDNPKFEVNSEEKLDMTDKLQHFLVGEMEPEIEEETDCGFFENVYTTDDTTTSGLSTATSSASSGSSSKKKTKHNTSQRRRFLLPSPVNEKNKEYVYSPNIQEKNFKLKQQDFPPL